MNSLNHIAPPAPHPPPRFFFLPCIRLSPVNVLLLFLLLLFGDHSLTIYPPPPTFHLLNVSATNYGRLFVFSYRVLSFPQNLSLALNKVTIKLNHGRVSGPLSTTSPSSTTYYYSFSKHTPLPPPSLPHTLSH